MLFFTLNQVTDSLHRNSLHITIIIDLLHTIIVWKLLLIEKWWTIRSVTLSFEIISKINNDANGYFQGTNPSVHISRILTYWHRHNTFIHIGYIIIVFVEIRRGEGLCFSKPCGLEVYELLHGIGAFVGASRTHLTEDSQVLLRVQSSVS